MVEEYPRSASHSAATSYRASGASPELPEIISVISSPISPLRLSARSDLRYLFVLATVHYDVLSDGQYRLDVSKAVAGVGWWV